MYITRVLRATAGISSLLLGFILVASATAEVDSGTAKQSPWSGYWWQHRAGGLTGPLQKYDRLTGAAAETWERQAHVSPDVPEWFGHCHAWAAASVSEREPQGPRTREQVGFGVGDQKGLLSACHAQDVANSYGDRYGDGNGSEDRLDLKPDELWRLLQMYVKQQKIPLILDLEAGEEVWNYPIFQYQVQYQSAGDNWYDARMELVAADNNVDPDFVGTSTALHVYTFRFQFANGAIVMGSGEWTGQSIEDHPDFAWYPYVAVAENPELDVEQVSNIVGYAVGGNNPPGPDGDEGDAPELEPPSEDPNADPNTPNPNTPNPNTPNPNTPNPNTPDPNTPDPNTPDPNTPDPNTPDPNTPDTPDSDTPDSDTPTLVQWRDLLSPDELLALVANRTSHFELDVFVDRGDGGRYHAGEPIGVSFRCGSDGYLYLFDIGPEGGLTLVFPLPGHPNRVEADTHYDLPWEGEAPWFFAGQPGQHDLKAIVTKRPIRITGLHVSPAAGEVGKEPKPDQGQDSKKEPPARPPQDNQQQDNQQHGGSGPSVQGPQQIYVYPSAQRRVRRRLFGFFRKGEPLDAKQDQKVTEFAQDLCSYFVFPAKQDKPNRKQDRKQE